MEDIYLLFEKNSIGWYILICFLNDFMRIYNAHFFFLFL
jgi:hypothetical protein